MKNNYYLTQEGILQREGNTVYFVNKDIKRALPIEKIYSIYAYKTLTLSAGVIGLLCQKGIPVHFFGWYGNYEGTLWPKDILPSGEVIIKQAEHYIDKEKRLYLARQFFRGAILNIARNLSYYSNEYPEFKKYLELIQKEEDSMEEYSDISQLMGAEGRIRDAYYEALDTILPEDYKIGFRQKRPPSNKGNALISFGNGMMYSTVLTEIYNTHLNPTISYLHEPYERRFSLALDVAEIFKPIIVDRVIMKLVNKRMLGDEHFDGELGNMRLSDKGRKIFLQEYNDKLTTTIKHKGLGREVSYQRLIRLELYKLEQHLIGGRRYRALIMWW
ncbi:MAG: type I-B CRISPR-associated endonuclease Cas1b [Thermoplasmata archaeon]